jgi:hypothetical protein
MRKFKEGITMLYRVTYRSMTAFYGPNFIEADDEHQARRKFAGSAFSPNEYGLINVREISVQEMRREMQRTKYK